MTKNIQKQEPLNHKKHNSELHPSWAAKKEAKQDMFIRTF